MMRLKELETLNKDNHATKKAENEQLYKKISSDIAMALAEIKGDAEALYKPLDDRYQRV